jgi:hypothetical protein
MDKRIPAEKFHTFRAELRELAPTVAAREALAEQAGVDPKTIKRLDDSLPSQLGPFIKVPRLLRALLTDLEREAA